MARDDFSAETIRRLGERVGLLCSNPDCGVHTKGAHTVATKAANVGKACHIHAASPGGPRYDASQTPEQRTSIENGIWLCSNCGTHIDNDEAKFPASLLRLWKVQAEHEAAQRIGKAATAIRRTSVRLRASLDSRSVAQFEPVITFTMTNATNDEINLSAIKVVRNIKGEVRHDLLSTKPTKGDMFRLAGQEQLTFKVAWDDIFPDDLDDPCGIDDVTEFYVESIATEERWKLPEEDLTAIRDGVRETISYRREKAEWVMTCRSCENKTSWMARPPRRGEFGVGGLGEEPGWTAKDFPHQFPMESTGLCPTCSAEREEPE